MEPDDGLSSSGDTTAQQFEEALREAEALMRQADREQEKAERVLAAEIGTVAVAIAVTVTVVVLGFSSGILGRVVVLVFGSLAGLVAAAGMHVTVQRRLAARAKRDEQAAVDIVSLLREVLLLITDDDHWDETQLRLARARISRFPLGGSGISEL